MGEAFFQVLAGGGKQFLKVSRGGGEGYLKVEMKSPELPYPSSIAWSLGHLTCYKQDRDTYDSIFKTLDPKHSHRTIKSKFQLGTKGTYLNLVQKK